MDYYQRMEGFVNSKIIPVELINLIEKFYPNAENSYFFRWKKLKTKKIFFQK